MAGAVSCDIDGKVFTDPRLNDTQTGRWYSVTVGDVRLVYAAFHVPTEELKASARGGTTLDMCGDCAIKHLTRGRIAAQKAQAIRYYSDDVPALANHDEYVRELEAEVKELRAKVQEPHLED